MSIADEYGLLEQDLAELIQRMKDYKGNVGNKIRNYNSIKCRIITH